MTGTEVIILLGAIGLALLTAHFGDRAVKRYNWKAGVPWYIWASVIMYIGFTWPT